MKIGFLQFFPARNDVQKNIAVIHDLVQGKEFDLMVLPELANSGYFYFDQGQLKNVSEAADGSGPFLSSLQEICNQKNACIITGFSEFDGEHLYNASAAILGSGVIAHYRKIHLYNLEKRLFQPGNTGLQLFTFNHVNIGMIICFDWIFPEVSRKLALDGAQIIAHPANLVTPYCQPAMVTRSIENRVFTITANRYGSESSPEGEIIFTGASQITSPRGQILAKAPIQGPQVQIIDVDPLEALDKEFSPANSLFIDRRPEHY